jgi:hypothetical protein
MGNTLRGNPRMCMTMLIVNTSIMVLPPMKKEELLCRAPYLPGWRGGRRESGALRTTDCLNPPDFAPDFGDFPPD